MSTLTPPANAASNASAPQAKAQPAPTPKPAAAPANPPAAESKPAPSENAKKLAERRKTINAAKTVVRSWLYSSDTTELSTDVVAALKTMIPNRASGGRVKRATVLDNLAELFKTAPDGVVGLFDIFKRFKMGEGEMRVRIRQLINQEADKRVWISYDADKEQYKLEGTGAKAPKGWTGHLPPAQQ